MAKKNFVYERIEDDSKTLEPVSVAEVEHALAAEPVEVGDVGGSPVAVGALRSKLMAELVSTGGRPARRDASLRKVSMTDAEWAALLDVTRRLKRQGVNATPGQVAGLLLQQSLNEVLLRTEGLGSDAKGKSRSRENLTDTKLEETLETVLAAAASAEVHLEQLRPVALELLRKMREQQGRAQDDDDA